MSASDSGVLVILGNGFDLDLGLPTSYKSFFESCEFPFVKGDSRVYMGHLITGGIEDR